MPVVDVRVVLVAVDHGLMAMPVRVLGSSKRAIGVTVSMVLIMVMFVTVL